MGLAIKGDDAKRVEKFVCCLLGQVATPSLATIDLSSWLTLWKAVALEEGSWIGLVIALERTDDLTLIQNTESNLQFPLVRFLKNLALCLGSSCSWHLADSLHAMFDVFSRSFLKETLETLLFECEKASCRVAKYFYWSYGRRSKGISLFV